MKYDTSLSQVTLVSQSRVTEQQLDLWLWDSGDYNIDRVGPVEFVTEDKTQVLTWDEHVHMWQSLTFDEITWKVVRTLVVLCVDAAVLQRLTKRLYITVRPSGGGESGPFVHLSGTRNSFYEDISRNASWLSDISNATIKLSCVFFLVSRWV